MAVHVKIKSIKALKDLPPFVYVLFGIAALGLLAGFYRLYAGLGSTTNLSTVFPWGLWISFDLSMVAFSGAAFTLAALVYIFHMHELHAAVRPTVLFGFLGYSSVLVVLFFDLGRWDRFWHFLVYPNFSSALFEVSWCIAIYTTILVYELSPVILARFKNVEKISKFLGKLLIGMVIAGITLSSMHQSSLGSLFVIQTHRLNPLWYSKIQPELFLVSSLAAGISTIIIGAYISIWLFKQTLRQKMLEQLGRIVPWILAVYLLMKAGDFVLGEKWTYLPGNGLLNIIYFAELALLGIAALWFSIKRNRSTYNGALIGALFVAAGILLNRFSVTWFAINPLGENAYFPSWIEIALMVGVASGVLAVYALIAHFFPVFAETFPAGSLAEARAERSRPARETSGD